MSSCRAGFDPRDTSENEPFTLSENGLTGKVAIVASRHSGKCIASELSRIFLTEGCRVYVAESNPKIVDIILQESKENLGIQPYGRSFDFFEAGTIEGFVRFVMEREGRIDILATDLGLLDFIYYLNPFLRQERTHWETQIRDIFEAALLWTRAVIPPMTQNEHGRIIHVVSDAARIGVPKMSIYGACKAAVSAFCRSLARELARHRITVNCVSLGIQEIDEIKDPSEEAVVKLDKTLNFVPLRRYGEPEEIAAMVAYLASDLGAYVTGQTFSVSGGLVMT